jgi:hypothetical protein
MRIVSQPPHPGCTILERPRPHGRLSVERNEEYNKIKSCHRLIVTHGTTPGIIHPAIHLVRESRRNASGDSFTPRDMAVIVNLYPPDKMLFRNELVEQDRYQVNNPSNIGRSYSYCYFNSGAGGGSIAYKREIVRVPSSPSGQTYTHYYVKTLRAGYGGTLIDDEKLYGIPVVDEEQYKARERDMNRRYNDNWMLSIFNNTRYYEFGSWAPKLFISEDVFDDYPQMSKRRMRQLLAFIHGVNEIIYVPRLMFDKMFVTTPMSPSSPNIEVLQSCKHTPLRQVRQLV